MRHKTRHKSTW